MNAYHSEIAFNNELRVGGVDWQVGNSLTPLDFAARVPGPTTWGAGVVAPAGAYATALDVGTKRANLQEQPRSLVPHAVTAAALIALLMVRR